MRTFRYRALAADGSLRHGQLTAASLEAAALALHRLRLEPNRLAQTERRRRWWERPGLGEQATAVRSLATLIASGAPLPAAVATVGALARSPVLAESMSVAGGLLAEGSSLALALDRSGAVPPAAVGLIQASERAGGLAGGLVEAADLLEQEQVVIARLKRALTYPAILLGTGILSILLITLVVLPKFAELLGDLGRELPLTTRLLLGTSTALRQWGLLGAATTVAAMAGFSRWARNAERRRQLHDLLLRMPGLGPIRHALATGQFARSLASAIRAGSPLLPALTFAADSLGDAAVRARIGHAIADVGNGAPVNTALAVHGAVAPGAVPLVALGEASGRLAEMLTRAGQLAQADADSAIDRGIVLLEPALVLLIGAVIAFVAGALFQAVYSLGPAS